MAFKRAALVALALAARSAFAQVETPAPSPAETPAPAAVTEPPVAAPTAPAAAGTLQVSRTLTMGYTLKRVDNYGAAIAGGSIATFNPDVSPEDASSQTTVTDSYPNAVAGCYYLETFSTATDPVYLKPELWFWQVPDQIKHGYGFDGQTFSFGGALCGIPYCYDNCREENKLDESEDWSKTDECANFELLYRECKCSDDDVRTEMGQAYADAGCTVPMEPYTVLDELEVPVKEVTMVAETHKTYTTYISLLLANTALTDNNIASSFVTQFEGNGMAAFLGVYPYSLVKLVSVNGKPTADVLARRRLGASLDGRRLPVATPAPDRALTRLTIAVNAETKNPEDQAARYESLESKPMSDFTALVGQLHSTVKELSTATLMSVESYSATATVVDAVTFDVQFLGPTPEPTKAPTPAPAVDANGDGKPDKPTLVEKPQPKSDSAKSSGGSGIGIYVGLAAAGLVGLGLLYCLIGGAIRAAGRNKGQSAAAAATQRAADDEAFRNMQAANAAKIAAANSSAVPLD